MSTIDGFPKRAVNIVLRAAVRVLMPVVLLLAAACDIRTDRGAAPDPEAGDREASPTPRELPPAADATPHTSPSPVSTATTSHVDADPTPPSAELSRTGPWLVGEGDAGPVVINPDGSGYRRLFAEHSQNYPWRGFAVSTRGWVAAYVDETVTGVPRIVFTQLPNTSAQLDVPILSQELSNGLANWQEAYDPDDAQDVYSALRISRGDSTLQWSPDGETLAFVAALDGPSADLYSYNIKTEVLIRLTDGPNSPLLRGWSPDGKWILHQEISGIHRGLENAISFRTHGIWAAAADGSSSVRAPDVKLPFIYLGWISATEFLALQGVDRHYDLDYFGLELYDIDAGSQRLYYAGSVGLHAFDPQSGAIAFVPIRQGLEPRNTLEDGLYLVSPSEPVPRPIGFHEYFEYPEDRHVRSIKWVPGLGAFVSQLRNGKLLAIRPDGEIVLDLDGICESPRVSPSEEIFAHRGCSVYFDQIEVRDWSGRLIQDFRLDWDDLWFWAHDSAGIYFVRHRSSQLNLIALDADAPRVIHANAFVSYGGQAPQWVVGNGE